MHPHSTGLPPGPPSPRPRTFQCNGSLWENLEQAAREQGCSVDQIIHEALTRYLQQPRPRAAPPAPPPSPVAPPPLPAPPASLRGPAPARPLPVPPAPLPVPPAPPTSRPQAPPSRPQVPPLPPRPVAAAPPARTPPPLPPSPTPPRPVPSFVPTPPRPAPALFGATLAILHGGRRYTVDVPGFVIGRGKQLAGLSIKDPNISRRHAVIERDQGIYYLVDMGSTNGTHVNGVSIQRHPIREGDVVRIADEELIFTYRQ